MLKITITEMYPRMSSEIVGSADHSLVTTALNSS